MAHPTVVVVGAGMAGLMCAQRLQQAGYAVSVLEKSRGLGGRLATRRIDGMPFDHGARYVQPQGSMLQKLTEYWLDRGLLIEWQPHLYCLDGNGQLKLVPSTSPYYVAPAGMSAIGKSLAANLTVHRQQRVIAIALNSSDGWLLTAERTDNGDTLQYSANAVVFTMPAPQLMALLKSPRLPITVERAVTALSTVAYAPCITVMAQYSQIVQAQAPLPELSTTPWMVEGHADTPFFWIGLDSSKRQTESLNVVLQSSAALAERWLDAENLQPAGEAVLSEAGKLIVPWLAQPYRWQVHRWRYALVEQPCRKGLVTISETPPMVASGDWCGDRRLDTALESGWAAAAAINRHLVSKPLPDFPETLIAIDG